MSFENEAGKTCPPNEAGGGLWGACCPPFDVVIPLGPRDEHVLKEQISYTRQNVVGFRKIFIVTRLDIGSQEDYTVIPEDIFPFSIDDMVRISGNKRRYKRRSGWYLQQLIKLYVGFVFPEITDRYLVVDADTFFLKPTTFIVNNKPCYNFGKEDHKPYFNHIDKLFGGTLEKMDLEKSGICHHMMMERRHLREIFDKVEKIHRVPFWQAFLKSIDVQDYLKSGASEYEIYFNFMLKYHPDEIVIRPLEWINYFRGDFSKAEGKNYVSYHWHLR